MLDLSLIKESYLEIKLPNGDILNLLRCNQGMLSTVAEMSEKIKKGLDNPRLIEDELYKFTTNIINRNKEGKVYKQNDIGEMIPLNVVMVLIEAYVAFTTETLSNPN